MTANITGTTIIKSIITMSLVILLAILSLITMLAVFFSAYIPLSPGEVPLDAIHFSFAFGHTSFVTFCIPLLLLIIFYVAMKCVLPKIRNVSLGGLATILLVVYMVLQLAIISSSINYGVYPYADSIRLDELARALLSGNYAVFADRIGGDTAPYLQWYPFQSGSVILMALIYRIFGEGNQVAFQVLSAAFNSVSAISLLLICDEVWGRPSATRVSFVVLITSFPLVFSATFVYGNSIGLGLALFALLQSMIAMNENRAPNARLLATFLTMLSMSLSMIVKSTNILFLFGIAFGWFVYVVRKRRLRFLPLLLAVFLLINSAPSFATRALERKTDMSFGAGMPKLSWIAMGLRDDGLSAVPGWWGPYPSMLFEEADGDIARQSDAAKKSIQESIKEFAADPEYTARFFSKKLTSEWADPTFMSLYYYGIGSSGVDTEDVPLMLTAAFTGFTTNRVLIEFMEAHQWLVYIGSAMTFAVLLFKRSERRWLEQRPEKYLSLGFAFFAGFGCFLLWEAKGVYAFPFFLLLIPFASLFWASTLERNGN